MAFNFGAPSPAPSTGAFSFGASPAPTGGGGFSFGSSSPAPAAGAFGSPAPAPSSSTGFFGSTPAPSSTGLFGAPAPAAGGGFSSFGSPSPANTQASTSSAAPAHSHISLRTKYSELPPHYRQAIDQLHDLILQHKRTMNHVHAMGPQPLAQNTLPEQIHKLQHQQMRTIQQQLQQLDDSAEKLLQKVQNTYSQSHQFGKWPLEALAQQRGIRFDDEKKEETGGISTMRVIFDGQLNFVDRIQDMPSPYFWHVLVRLQEQLENVHDRIQRIQNSTGGASAKQAENLYVANELQHQHGALLQLEQKLIRIRQATDQVRQRYSQYETEYNVLMHAEKERLDRSRRLDELVQIDTLKAMPASAAAQNSAPAPFSTGSLFGSSAPAPSSGGLFGSSTPAPSSGGLFGSSAPAPSSGGLFGSSAPAPSSGGLFGSSAPAPSSGGLFGSSAPAPSTGGLFGSNTSGQSPAPSGAFSFGGSSSTAAPATPAAPAGGFSFGATSAAPTPAPSTGGFSFGGSTSTPSFGSSSNPLSNTTTHTPKKKSSKISSRFGR